MHLLGRVDFIACDSLEIGFFLWAPLALSVGSFGRDHEPNKIEHEWAAAGVVKVDVDVPHLTRAVGRAQWKHPEVPGMWVAGQHSLMAEVGLEPAQISLLSHSGPVVDCVATNELRQILGFSNLFEVSNACRYSIHVPTFAVGRQTLF